jgi:hypothetical protein
MLYQFICKSHKEPKVIELSARISDPTPKSVPCTEPGCTASAERLWHGQTFYAKVPGGHGGGPATR